MKQRKAGTYLQVAAQLGDAVCQYHAQLLRVSVSAESLLQLARLSGRHCWRTDAGTPFLEESIYGCLHIPVRALHLHNFCIWL